MPEFGFLQDDGQQSIANIDKLLHSNGNLPTVELRLTMQKVIIIVHKRYVALTLFMR